LQTRKPSNQSRPIRILRHHRGSLVDARAKFDLMICLRGCEIAGVHSQSRGFEPSFGITRSRPTPETWWCSFRRLVLSFDDRDRLAHLRANRLRREREQSRLRLRTGCASTFHSLRLAEANRLALFNVQIASSL